MPEADWRKRHREIHKIHRGIIARLDLWDQKAPDREKERERRRAEAQAAQTALDASLETLQAKVERVSEAVDKRFDIDIWKPRLHDRKAVQPMAEPERQSKLDRLEEVTIVQTAILGRLERKYDEAIRRHDEEFSRLQSALEKLASSGQKTNDAVDKLLEGSLNTRAAVDSLIETVDKFIRGKESNGHKSGGKKK